MTRLVIAAILVWLAVALIVAETFGRIAAKRDR